MKKRIQAYKLYHPDNNEVWMENDKVSRLRDDLNAWTGRLKGIGLCFFVRLNAFIREYPAFQRSCFKS